VFLKPRQGRETAIRARWYACTSQSSGCYYVSGRRTVAGLSALPRLARTHAVAACLTRTQYLWLRPRHQAIQCRRLPPDTASLASILRMCQGFWRFSNHRNVFGLAYRASSVTSGAYAWWKMLKIIVINWRRLHRVNGGISLGVARISAWSTASCSVTLHTYLRDASPRRSLPHAVPHHSVMARVLQASHASLLRVATQCNRSPPCQPSDNRCEMYSVTTYRAPSMTFFAWRKLLSV